MYSLNFIAYAIDKKGFTYESFLIPFTFFALINHKDSHVEIIVLDPEKFNKRYEHEINFLKKINNNFLIRKPQYKLNKNVYNTYRFFETPTVKATYTYIGDIDIMLMEDILPGYLKKWPGKLPYSNMLRKKKSSRITGIHMVITDKFFTPKYKKCQRKYYLKNQKENDELILGRMCKEIHGLPKFNFRYRPIFGIHFSPKRGPNKKMNLETNDKYYKIFFEIKKKYPEIFKFKIFNNLVVKLDTCFKKPIIPEISVLASVINKEKKLVT